MDRNELLSLWKCFPRMQISLAGVVCWRKVDQLRAEWPQLRRENLELRTQAGYWRSRHDRAVQVVAAIVGTGNEQLAVRSAKLQGRTVWLRRSEKQSSSDTRPRQLDEPGQR